MFHFSGCPDAMLYIHMTSTMIGRVSPFGNPRLSVFVARRGLSQLTTSFIDFWSQGIHLVPLVA